MVDHPADDRYQVGRLGVEHGEAGVEAADLEQVGEQALEPVQLGLQQFGAAGHRRIELLAGGEDQVGRHAYRGQRRPQLVRHVGGEPSLHARHLLQPHDLALQVGGHLVEGSGQPGQVVFAVQLHTLVEQPGGQSLRGTRGHPYRTDHHAGHQRGDQRQQSDKGHPGHDERRAHEVGRGHLVVEREQVVQLKLATVAVDPGAEDQARPVAVGVGVGGHQLVRHLAPVPDVVAQLGEGRTGHDVVRLRVGPGGVGAAQLARVVDEQHHDLDAATLVGRLSQVRDHGGDRRVQRRVVALRHQLELARRVPATGLHLLARRLHLRAQETAGDRAAHQPAEPPDEQRGQHERDRHHAYLQRAAPAVVDREPAAAYLAQRAAPDGPRQRRVGSDGEPPADPPGDSGDGAEHDGSLARTRLVPDPADGQDDLRPLRVGFDLGP